MAQAFARLGSRVTLVEQAARILSVEDADIGAIDELTYLLESGSDRIGALDFQLSPTRYVPRSVQAATLEELLTAAEKVERGIPLTPELDQALFHGSSLGGARPKAMIEEDEKKLIAKFSSSSDTYNVVKAEFIAMRLAAKAGLNVAPVRLAQEKVEEVYGILIFVPVYSATGAQGRIEGFALAGGCEIALTCDLLVASESAKIGIREVKVGLFAAAGGLMRLGARVGLTKAMELAVTGEPMGSADAKASGLLSEVTADGGALDAAVAWAERIAENAPLAVSASKKLVRAAGMGIDEDSLWEMQAPLMQKVFSSNDAKEGPAAFAEKRAPNWTGT